LKSLSPVDDVKLHHAALPPLAALEHDWRCLEALSRPSFFTSWDWIGTLLSSLPEASRPQLVRGLAQGKTVGLGLLGSRKISRRYGLVSSRSLFLNATGIPSFDSITIEHNGLLAQVGQEAAVLDALVSWFASCDKSEELHINGSLVRVPESAVERRGLDRVEISVPSYSIDLSRLAEGDGELHPILSANARQQLRQAMRHFERFGPLQITAAATTTEAIAFFTAMKALHWTWWERRGKPHAFSDPFFERFHGLLIAETFDRGGTQLLQICAGNRLLGYLYNFRLGDRIYAYQSGFTEAARHERPGAVAHALAIQHAFRNGAHVYDFMAGHNRLKQSFSTTCEPMLWQVLQRPKMAFRLENAAGRLMCVARAARNTTLPARRIFPQRS